MNTSSIVYLIHYKVLYLQVQLLSIYSLLAVSLSFNSNDGGCCNADAGWVSVLVAALKPSFDAFQ